VDSFTSKLVVLLLTSSLALSCKARKDDSSVKGRVDPAKDNLIINRDFVENGWDEDTKRYREVLKSSLVAYQPSVEVSLKFNEFLRANPDIATLQFKVEGFIVRQVGCSNRRECYAEKRVSERRYILGELVMQGETYDKVGDIVHLPAVFKCGVFLSSSLYRTRADGSLGNQFQGLRQQWVYSENLTARFPYKVSKIEGSPHPNTDEFTLDLHDGWQEPRDKACAAVMVVDPNQPVTYDRLLKRAFDNALSGVATID
jgi:hypothetical protein